MKPGPVLIIVALLWLFLAGAAYFVPFLFILWLYFGLGCAFLAIADFLLLKLLCDRLCLRRSIAASLAQGRAAKVKLLISRETDKQVRFEQARFGKRAAFFVASRIRLFDLYPPSMECSCGEGFAESAFPAVLNRKLLIENKTGLSFEYTLTPRERGPWVFPGTELLLASPLWFWDLKVFHPCESQGRTYPDFNKIKAGADLRFLLEKTGIKQVRRRGQGMEFRGLRDYQEGDALRDVDWRATSRLRGIDGQLKLIVREYQEERDQQVLLLLDTGYRLHKQESTDFQSSKLNSTGRQFARTQFDSALEAALLLSWVSLKYGDSVAAAAFGKTSRWLSPQKGMSAFLNLMNGLYDLKSSSAPSSPFSCLEEALARLKRRTFIIMISNFREEDGESLSWILRRLEKRHLLLLVSLKEKDAEALAARPPKTFDHALETAAAFSYLSSRRNLYKTWEHSGLLTLEASAETLSPALINRYLQVKRTGRL